MKATDDPVMLNKMINGLKIRNLPECQLALNLFGCKIPDVKFTSFILAPFIRGPVSVGVIRNTAKATIPMTESITTIWML